MYLLLWLQVIPLDITVELQKQIMSELEILYKVSLTRSSLQKPLLFFSDCPIRSLLLIMSHEVQFIQKSCDKKSEFLSSVSICGKVHTCWSPFAQIPNEANAESNAFCVADAHFVPLFSDHMFSSVGLQCDSPYIITFFSAFFVENRISICTEFMDGEFLCVVFVGPSCVGGTSGSRPLSLCSVSIYTSADQGSVLSLRAA